MHTVTVTAMVASRDKSAAVTMAIPHKDCAVQFTPTEARDLARSLMESAYSAESDSNLVANVLEGGGTMHDAAALLATIRAAQERTGR
jgi:hypothetical protein